MSPLEAATTDELINELSRRADEIVVYIAVPDDEGEGVYCRVGRKGNPAALLGHLEVMKHKLLEEALEEMDNGGPESEEEEE